MGAAEGRRGRLRCFAVGKDAALCKGDAMVAIAAHLHPGAFSLQQHRFMNKKIHVNEKFHEKVSPLKSYCVAQLKVSKKGGNSPICRASSCP